MFLHLDCQWYLGDRPCKFNRLCEGCTHYEPMGPRVLIIKLGALGDVVRTHALIAGLPGLTTDPPHVTWLTAPAAVDLVKRMPGVHRVLAYGEESLARLRVERFDHLICLDKEAGPCAVAMTTTADNRHGIGLSRYGTPYPFNEFADYYFELGLNNDEKFFKNTKSYPELMYDALGLLYKGQTYEIEPTESDRAAAAARFAEFGTQPADAIWIGINPGAGNVFAYKAWREDGYIALIRAVGAAKPNARFVLLGGPDERELIARIQAATSGAPVFSGGTNNPLGTFTALIERCHTLVCGDTLAMHLAIARKRRVVAIFGPTCEQEIDLFGRGEKIKSPIECSPCYRRTCDKSPTCQDLNKNEEVLRAVLAQLER